MSKSYLNQLQDKTSYIHIFSALMQNPMLLTEYKLTTKDFPEKFHQILFSAIYNLFDEGITELSDITIDGYLKDTPTQHKIFEDGRGIEYIEFCLDRGEPANFDYHFTRVKKFTLLRKYHMVGLKVEEIYSVGYLDAQAEVEQSERFNSMSINDIIRYFDAKLLDIKDEFVFEKEGYGGHASENVDDILNRVFEQPDYGAPFQSGYYNTATRGARRRKLYCCSGNSGSGKTRKGLGDLAYDCVPIIYSIEKQAWIFTGNRERGLFISTELEEDEVVIPLICFIAEVEEEALRNNEITEDERARLRTASKILKKCHIWIEELFDFDIDDLTHLIQKYVNKHDVGYVFFDYIQTTLKMFDSMAKRGAKNLQEHQLLRILSVHLKNMCNRFNVWIGTATQLNSKWKDDGNVNLDETAIEGSKSISNKLDLGAIQIGLTAKDEALWEEIKNEVEVPFGLEPTHTVNIYKNRGNRWKFIRIWIHFNMGTLRVTDLFVTNYKGQLVNMKAKQFTFEDDEFDIDYDMSAEDVEAFLETLEEDSFTRLEYKNTEFDENVEQEMEQELQDTYTEMGADNYTEDPLPDTFYEEEEYEGKKETFGGEKDRW